MAVGLIKKQIIHSNSPIESNNSPIRLFGSKKRKDALRRAKNKYETEMQAYKDFDIKNVYGDVESYAKGLQEDIQLENVYEDIGISTQAYDYQQQQIDIGAAGAQQAVRQAAGAGGAAGTAQALMMQRQRGAQQITSQRARDIQQAKQLSATGAERVQTQEMQFKTGRELLKAQAAGEADILRRRGAESVQQMEMDRQATQLGMAMGEVESAQAAIAADKAMWGQIAGAAVGAAATIATGGASDIRLKDNITKTGVSESGIPIYTFNYKGDDTLWSGTMAQDLIELGREDAVTTTDDGYYAVHYDKIDVNMKQLKK